MRSFALLMAVGCFFPGQNRATADQVLTPAEAAKQVGKDRVVTVEFVVKSCHPVLPDGKEFRLFSESSSKDKGTFVVHLTEKTAAAVGAKDLEKHFLGKRIRVTGKVGKTVFSSFPETRPGITVDDPVRVKVVDKKD